MLQLTAYQIEDALRLARDIEGLEHAKKDMERQAKHGYRGGSSRMLSVGKVSIQVPEAVVRTQIASDLDRAHTLLAELGIELLPQPDDIPLAPGEQ